MNQKQAITNAIFNGQRLTTINGFQDFGSAYLNRRILEVEARYDIYLDRKKRPFISRYNVKGYYFEYKLNLSKYKKQVNEFKNLKL